MTGNIGKINVSYSSCKTDEDGDIEITFKILNDGKYAVKEIVNAIKGFISMGKEIFVLTISEYKNKRSLMQNNMMWALLEIMGNALGQSAYDCYIDMLESYGAKHEYMMCLPQAKDMLKEHFRVVKEVERRNYNGVQMIVFKCFYGSSKFNTKEMSVFIEDIFQKLAELGADFDRDVEYYYKEWKRDA